jgi:hypothetical protein
VKAMVRLEDTKEYQLGRNGEILIHSFAIEHGCTTFDIGGTAHGRAPMLQSRWKNLIAPDAMHMRNVPLWGEYKTKTNVWNWNGGSPEMPERAPPCLAHCIERRAWKDYKLADKLMPVTIWFLTLNTAQLHVASLDELGEPFHSVRDDFPVVNFPLSRMHRVATFDRKRLWQYFRKDRRHDGLPTEHERKELLNWLRPAQLEMEGFTEHFLIWREQCWAKRTAA